MFKRRSVVLLVMIGLVLASVTGCGFASTSISGQVVLDGVGTNNCSISIVANGKVYFGDTVTSDGRFSHSKEGFDSEFCVPGCVITVVVTSTAQGACKETVISNYTVMPGANNFGPIEIGTKGLALVAPAESAAPAAWPVSFNWDAYSRADVTGVAYSLKLYGPGYFGGTMEYWASADASDTTRQLAGSETSMSSISHWTVTAKFTRNGINFEQTAAPRPIDLPATM